MIILKIDEIIRVKSRNVDRFDCKINQYYSESRFIFLLLIIMMTDRSIDQIVDESSI